MTDEQREAIDAYDALMASHTEAIPDFDEQAELEAEEAYQEALDSHRRDDLARLDRITTF